MGQFPAAALMYRKGYVRQGEAVVHEERPLNDLWQRKVPLIAEDRSFDPNRYKAQPAARSRTSRAAPIRWRFWSAASKSSTAATRPRRRG